MAKSNDIDITLSGDGESANILQSKALQKRKKKLSFSRPNRTPVVIYDSTGSEFVQEAIRAKTLFCTLEVRHTVNLHFSILLRAVGLFLYRALSRDPYWRLAGAGVIYDCATLMIMKPKVVLTFIDNSHRFGILSRIYSRAQFFAIQNGFRGPRVQDFPRKIHVKNLFCHAFSIKCSTSSIDRISAWR